MKILIAEDDYTTRTMLTALLRKWDYEPVVTSDGAEAWTALQKADAPNMVLLDWNMPQIDGLDVVRRVRALKNSSQPYIVMLTSKTEEIDIVKGLEAGANDYVIKPSDPGVLRARLDVGRRMVSLQATLVEKVQQLQKALNEVQTLSGLIPICAYCKKIRDDKGFWEQVDSYIRKRTSAEFTHGCCPECEKKLIAEMTRADAVKGA